MKISEEAQSLLEELKRVRRELHRIPETAYTERQTGDYIVRYLEKLKPDKIERMAETGVRAVFMAERPEKTLAFRADMDALPIPEETACAFASQHEGAMHACGHDAHMAMVLCLASLISGHRENLKHNIVLLFQPAEETIGGAAAMIKEGALKDPDVDEIYGMHLWPDIEAGRIGLKAGAVMARMCDLNIEISGRGAHGAKPHLGIDALVAAAHFINMLQTIVSRSVDPYERAVITVGKIEGGTARNVICEKVRMEGTIRTFKDSVFENAKNRMQDILRGLETAFGVETEYTESMDYPPVVNPEALVSKAQGILDGADVAQVKPIMVSEDFSYFQRAVPGLFLFLGVADESHREPLHSSTFDFDERVMLNGLEAFKRLAEI
jgi:amidohydrolase